MEKKTYAVGLRNKTSNETRGALIKTTSFNECVKKINEIIETMLDNQYLIKTITEL